MSNEKEKRDAVVKEVKRSEQEKRYLHLVQCNQQGQCLRWEEQVIERKITWKEIWEWEPARLSFLIKSTYDMLPTPVNLLRWKISEDNKCKCGKIGTLRHILSACPLGLKERFTWRHNEVLRVFSKYLKEKIKQINEGKIPTTEVKKKINFVKQGSNVKRITSGTSKVEDIRWRGFWEVKADLDSQLVFPVMMTEKRPDLVVWSSDRKHVIILELTVPWEDNIKDAEYRKEKRYEDLVNACKEKGWETEYYHLAVGCRGYVQNKTRKLLQNRFKIESINLKRMIKELQEAAEKASFFIWIKRDDECWLESTSNKASA